MEWRKNLFFHFDYSNNLHKQSTKLNDFYWEWAGRVEKDDKIAIEKHFSDRAKLFHCSTPSSSTAPSWHHFVSTPLEHFHFASLFFSSLSRSHQRHSQVYCDYNLHRVELCFFGQQWMEEEKEEAIRAWLYFFSRRLTFEKKNHRAAMFVFQADKVVKMNMREESFGDTSIMRSLACQSNSRSCQSNSNSRDILLRTLWASAENYLRHNGNRAASVEIMGLYMLRVTLWQFVNDNMSLKAFYYFITFTSTRKGNCLIKTW